VLFYLKHAAINNRVK